MRYRAIFNWKHWKHKYDLRCAKRNIIFKLFCSNVQELELVWQKTICCQVKTERFEKQFPVLICSVLFCSQLNDLFYPEDRKGVADKFPLKDDCSLFTTSYVKHSCNLPSLTSPLIAFSLIRMNILLSMFQSDDHHLSSFFSVKKLRSAICDNIL